MRMIILETCVDSILYCQLFDLWPRCGKVGRKKHSPEGAHFLTTNMNERHVLPEACLVLPEAGLAQASCSPWRKAAVDSIHIGRVTAVSLRRHAAAISPASRGCP